jgi:uncharacterized protein YjbI with pentapeptide repeats/nucleoside phosphorylase
MDKQTNQAYELDFVVVSTLDEEFSAVKKVFGLQEEDLKYKDGLRYYYKEIEGFRVGFYKFHQRGNLTSATETRQIIHILKPRFIILAGIAGGIRGNISLGDVAVSDNVVYYSYEKVDDKEGGPRPTTVAAPSKELNEIIGHVGVEWEKRVLVKRPEEGVTRVIRGLYLSGEEILGGGEEARGRVQELKNRYGKFIAVENEAGGVAEAVYGSSSEYIVIKGISDYAGESESQQQRDKWRDYASHTSAALSYELILTMAKVSPYSELIKLRGMLRGYLEEVKKEFEEKSLIDGKSLSEYYVESSFKLTKGDTWNKKDWEVDGKEWEIEDFLKDPKGWYIVIGAPFGSGKTSFVKHLGKKLAENLLKNMNDYNKYFPILVKLREADDIKSYGVYEQKNLEALLKCIRAENERRRVLLILDGLDEYKEIIDLFNYIAWLNNEYGIKVIVTSRLVEIPKQYIKEYVRLMPFNEDKVNEFFRKYGVGLDYDRCKAMGLEDDDISKPLFCWILCIVYPYYYANLLGVELSNEARKSLLYYIFIHSLIKGKHVVEVSGFEDYYSIEKEVLRYCAAMRNMLGRLEENQLKSLLESMNFENPYIIKGFERYLEPVLTSYFYSSDITLSEKRLDFIHESFKDYLLAEYYLENIRSGKMHRLNVGLPSKETMDFLKGLIEISKNVKAIEILKQVEGKIPLIFKDTDKIAENAKKFLEDESLVLAAEIHNEECWNIVKPGLVDYEYLWMYRWISLCVLKWIKPEEEIDGKKIGRMIKITSHNTPYYLKVMKKTCYKGADLAGANLSNANLIGADLSRADLRGANLSSAYLTNADLSEAELTEANISGADLIGANLKEAILMGANLVGANFLRADLTRANLEGAYLTGANLIYADLSEADLFGADLSDANLSYAIFSKADLSGVDLSGADMSGASLTGAFLIDAKTANIVINEETTTDNIVLVPPEVGDETENWLRRAIKTIDPKLRRIILRDNPDLRKLLKKTR